MKALIFAAGRGTRISRYLGRNPKCTVKIGNEKLIHYTVRLLKKHGISDIALVVGYKQQAVRDALSDMDVSFYYNPFFDVTNSIASAWFARGFFGEDDLFLMNGDVFMEERLLGEILCQQCDGPVLFSDETRKEEADYKFYYENGRLIKYGKELTGDDVTGEYIGVARLGKGFLPQFSDRLDQMIAGQQHGVWWENVLYSLSDQCFIEIRDISGRFWAEVDYIEDYERISSFVKTHPID